jgi:hypothetical protein
MAYGLGRFDCIAAFRAPTEGFGEPVAGSIPTIVRTYKAAVTRDIGRRVAGGRTIWQREFFDHVIREDEDWRRIHLYIETNPANWTEDAENPASSMP